MDGAELVIFDCDGVLVDSEVIACRVDAACLTEIGFPTTSAEVMERYVGVSAATMFADLAARHGRPLPSEFPETLRARLAAAFEAELIAMPAIAETLARLTSRRCVASSSTPDRLRHSLAVAGLLHAFDPHIFSATQVQRGKPAPDLFLFAAAQMNIAPQRCVVIEDSRAGVAAAVAAGMRVLGFAGGSHCGPAHAAQLAAAGAATVFADMRDLPKLIRSAD
jgi:HAD superfamily hydrolase (TIGR01509 family)